MNYTELATAIEETIENPFSAEQLELFVRSAERLIYQTVQLPALNEGATGAMTASNRFLSLPSDLLYVHSLAVVINGAHTYLQGRDLEFLREMYPAASVAAVPRFYAQYDEDTLMLAPTPDTSYAVELHYARYPPSIVDNGTSWLGDNFDNVLLNASLVEAIRFIKGPDNLIKFYQELYVQSISLLKNWGEGKTNQDRYRTGTPMQKVK